MESLIFAILLLLLMLLNATLVACEISMVKIRYSLSEDSDLEGLKEKWAVRFLIDNAEWTAQVMRFGIMLTTVSTGLCVVPLAYALLYQLTFLQTDGGRVLLSVLVFFMAGSLLSLLGFLTPRGFALVNPKRTLSAVSWIVVVVVILVKPWFQLQRALAKRIFLALGLNFKHEYNVLDFEVQIRALSDDEPNMSPQIRRIVQNSLRMSELEASDIILPRGQVQIMDINKSTEENITLARQTGHTRFPFCNEDLDDCLGLIHIKDLFRSREPIESRRLESFMRPIMSFQENERLEDVFSGLLARKAHMGLVKEEFGGVIGIITLEGIFESLVGAIDDEFDTPEVERIQPIAAESFTVDGLTPIHEVEERLGVNIDNTEASTFGGMLIEQLGRLPIAGECVHLEESSLEVEVQQVDDKRILSAKVSLAEDSDKEED